MSKPIFVSSMALKVGRVKSCGVATDPIYVSFVYMLFLGVCAHLTVNKRNLDVMLLNVFI